MVREELRKDLALVRGVMYLDIIALVIVAALAEEAVVNDFVDVELVEERVAVLGNGSVGGSSKIEDDVDSPWKQRQ